MKTTTGNDNKNDKRHRLAVLEGHLFEDGRPIRPEFGNREHAAASRGYRDADLDFSAGRQAAFAFSYTQTPGRP